MLVTFLLFLLLVAGPGLLGLFLFLGLFLIGLFRVIFCFSFLGVCLVSGPPLPLIAIISSSVKRRLGFTLQPVQVQGGSYKR